MDAALLFLIGPRGSGKSTLARLLAAQLDWEWIDADALLETRQGRSIRRLFTEEGETAFREMEAALLAEVCQWEQCVVATGGGVVLREDNRERLRTSGRCVWLTADAATLWQRMQADATSPERRPDLNGGGLAEVEEVLRVREPLYHACANLQVATGERAPDDIAREILAWWAQS